MPDQTMRQACRFSILLLGLALQAGATPQASDVLFWNGERHHLQTYPLEEFFSTNPDKRPKSDIVSTGLWRGYIATWEIVGDQLRLIDLEVNVVRAPEPKHKTGKASVFAETFPGQDVVVASWYTGELVLSNVFHYAHYKDYKGENVDQHTDERIVLRIESGTLTSGELHSTRYKRFRTTKKSRPIDLEAERTKAEVNALVERIGANTYLPSDFRNVFLYSPILAHYQAIVVGRAR